MPKTNSHGTPKNLSKKLIRRSAAPEVGGPDAVYRKIARRIRSVSTVGSCFGEVIYAPGGDFGPRTQHHYHMFVVLKGRARALVDRGPELEFEPGQMGLFLPAHTERFWFSPTQATHHTWCSIHPSTVDPTLAAACARAPKITAVSRRFEQLMEMGLSLPHAAGVEAAQLVETLGLACLHEYLFAAERALHGKIDELDSFRRALAWIAHRGKESIDLAALAREAGASPAHLVRLFRRHLGQTPMRYLWEARTRRGIQLLRETGLSVSEIADRSGFRSPFHFSRWVRGLTGVSPRAWRQREWTARHPSVEA